MFNTIKRLTAGFLIAALLMGTPALPTKDQYAGQVEAATVLAARVNSGILHIRDQKTVSAKCIKVLHRNDKVKVLSTGTRWVKVQIGSKIGYTQGKYLTTGLGGTASDKDGKSSNTKGQQVANFALKFVGNPYRWGGVSLTHGADCSGFVMSVYKHFGKSLPHSSAAQRHVGRRVGSLSAAKPGDIICYSGHVAIYLGNRKIVHASSRKTGIKISSNASYRHIVSIRRIF